jgi:hypothetical protein
VSKPVAHCEQLLLTLKLLGHTLHAALVQLLRHEQLHPLRTLPLTFHALPLQLAALVHLR